MLMVLLTRSCVRLTEVFGYCIFMPPKALVEEVMHSSIYPSCIEYLSSLLAPLAVLCLSASLRFGGKTLKIFRHTNITHGIHMPHVFQVFRPREKERYKLRKHRKNDLESFRKLQQVKKDFEKVRLSWEGGLEASCSHPYLFLGFVFFLKKYKLYFGTCLWFFAFFQSRCGVLTGIKPSF